ncbi:hypothetical protein D3C77_754400 [compost metagenome]
MHPEVGVWLGGVVASTVDAGFLEKSDELFHALIPLVGCCGIDTAFTRPDGTDI